MLCEKCHQNYATSVITKTVNGQTTVTHLCAECAFKSGYSNLFGGFSSFNPFISDMDFSEQTNQTRCPRCNTTFNEIIDAGVLGCDECYKTFYQQLMPTIESIHGKALHLGKIPQRRQKATADVDTLTELNERMKKAIEEQNFEAAAVLRDEIKQYKANSNEEQI